MSLRRTFVAGLALLASPVLAAVLHAQGAPSFASPLFADVRPLYSGERAKETVAFLDRFVRWPGNRGFDASIAHIAERLEQAGFVREGRASAGDRLVYRVERYPMRAPAWEPLDAVVEIAGDSVPLLRFATNRNMLATNSWATPSGGVEGEVVDGGDGSLAALDAAGAKGKIVLVTAGAGRVFAEAVTRRGAVGVLSYALPAYLQPEKNVNSIQFGGIPYDSVSRGWAISLSYAAHQRLRQALGAGTVRVRVRTDVAWTADAVEQTVVAEVRGRRAPRERFVFSAHVQEPGANDNASGVGAQVEMARVAAELLRTKRIDPLRTITFIWGDEIRSTDRYITQDPVRARGIMWGLSLDMVGEDTKKTGGTFLIEKMPDPSAIWTRGEEKHSEWGGRPLTKGDMTPHYFNDFVLGRALEQAATNGWVVKTNPFEGGSDHTPFLRAKKPGLLFWHFTDQFYHTDGDRIEMVSADELTNVGVTALVSALALTSADGATARRVVDEVRQAAVTRLATEGKLSAAAVTNGAKPVAERDILETWAAWYDGALRSAAEIEVGGASRGTRRAIERARGAVRRALVAETARYLP